MALAFIVGSTAISASAQDYATRNVGGWTVATSTDKRGCFLSRDYDRAGQTTILLGLDIDGANHLSVLNDNWSIQPKDRLRLTFRLSNGGYDKHFAVGMASDGKPGFVTSFEAKFPAYFAASTFLNISRGDVPVEKLALDGSGAAVAELRRCVAVQRDRGQQDRRALGARGQIRPDDIPTDPFAQPPPRETKRKRR